MCWFITSSTSHSCTLKKKGLITLVLLQWQSNNLSIFYDWLADGIHPSCLGVSAGLHTMQTDSSVQGQHGAANNNSHTQQLGIIGSFNVCPWTVGGSCGTRGDPPRPGECRCMQTPRNAWELNLLIAVKCLLQGYVAHKHIFNALQKVRGFSWGL